MGLAAARADAADFVKDIRPVLEAHCFDCHGNEEKPEGGLNLERFGSVAEALRDRAQWAAVLEKVESGQMPPPKRKDQPTAEERAAVVSWIGELAAMPDPALGAVDPGKPVLRHLTRLEYNNTLRDLFGLKHDVFVFPERLPVISDYFDPALGKMPEKLGIGVREYGLKYAVLLPDAGLPGENRAEHGYSNRGDAMNLSPLLLENYLQMARAVVYSPKLVRQSPFFRSLVMEPAAVMQAAAAPAEPAAAEFEAVPDFAPNLDLPRQATDGGAVTVAYQFRFTVSTAADEGLGGVWNAEAKDLKIEAGAPVDVHFGGRALRIIPAQPMWVAGFSTAEETSGEGLFTNGISGAKELRLDLALDGAERGEVITDLALCVLSRRGEKGTVAVTAHFTGGGEHTLRSDIPAGDGAGNTFYAFRAPDGEGIAAVSVDGRKFSGNYVLLDDLGWITNGGTGDPAQPDQLSPMAANKKREVAAQRLAAFLPKVFRHPVNPAVLGRYLGVFDQAVAGGRNFADAMREVLIAALASPEFLYFTGPKPEREGVRPLDPFELASRLSYFLWSAPPDDWLLEAALSGKLMKPAGLRAEVERMLGDPRCRELAESFAVQWLRLDQLYTAKPDPKLFAKFYFGQAGKRTLHAPMLVEALLLFETVMVENRSVLDFIDPGYTWVNLKLVKHYGLESASEAKIKALGLTLNTSDDLKDQRLNNIWWRTPLPDKNRGGFPFMAGPLTVTSLPLRTSPVKRGAWVLETIFNRPPQEPKIAFVLEGDDAPAASSAVVTQSVRQRFEAHRSQPACFSCHVRLDPPGFALERFDAVGAWREKDGGQPVDARAEWNGQAFDSPAGFKAAMMSGAGKRECVRGLVEHLMSYALGRRLELYDRPAVDAVLAGAEADGYRFHSIVSGIAASWPFLNTRSTP